MSELIHLSRFHIVQDKRPLRRAKSRALPSKRHPSGA